VSAECITCAELERAGRDETRQRDGTASVSLYRLIEHHIEEHGAEGRKQPGCPGCEGWENPHGIAPFLVARWSRHHWVQHQLGIVSGDPGSPLRFADMTDQYGPVS
jgi:hypothetical protein